MTNVSASLVKELRQRTGLGMMECKKALIENDGDIEKSIEYLRKSSALKAAKKSGNVAAEGVVAVKLSADNKFAVVLEVNSQTDFCARDTNFANFVELVLDKAIANKVSSVEQLQTEELEQKRNELVSKIGENINIRRLQTISAAENQVIGSYVHTNKRVASVILLDGGDAETAKNIAMHIAATKPLVVNPEDVDPALVAKEKEIYAEQAKESGKPAEIIEKMVDGRVNKFLAEVSLTQQSFVVEPDKKVADILKSADAKALSFQCFNLGEGIEKEEVDFAQEVQNSLNG